MQKVLITGGAGFIGLHLTRYLLEKGFAVDLADNFSRGVNDDELKKTANDKNVKLITVDLMDTGAISGLLAKDYDYIFHLAAIIGVANVLKQPYEVLRKNTLLLVNMLEYAKTIGNLKRFMFASTSEVYAGTLLNFDMKIPTPETTPLAVTDLKSPRTSYMLSKIYGEALCNASGLPVTNFRPHNIYGPRMGLNHVVPELLKKACFDKENKGLEVFSPDHKRTFCYIDDAVKILYLAATNDNCLGETINLGNQAPEIPMREVGKIVLATVGSKAAIIEMQATEGSPPRRCPDMSKTTSLIGFKAEVPLKDGISKTFDWYKENIFSKE
ncbi:MAG: NAD(P)-dependent oxidoreductase [Endomicrobium sp.]|jgi:nucleoside-diphosphate-sugar epimerase|nr:NAD(P)-dependent oxidoreductase [Endomicrobium sp.]